MNLKEKIVYYLIFGALAHSVYFTLFILFELHTLYKKIKQWN
jgi:hypothetical protein